MKQKKFIVMKKQICAKIMLHCFLCHGLTVAVTHVILLVIQKSSLVRLKSLYGTGYHRHTVLVYMEFLYLFVQVPFGTCLISGQVGNFFILLKLKIKSGLGGKLHVGFLKH